jgi:hypothetical protein
MNDAKNQTDNSFGDSFGNKPDDDSKNKQDNSGDPIRDRYKKNQEDINTSFTNDQNDDFNNEKKNNSSSTQNKRSKKSNTQNNLKDKVKDHYEKNQENINKEFEDKNGKQGKEETDTEREYKQTKAAYNKMREANTDRAKKMAEKLKEKMKYYENKIKKEKEESVNNEKQKSSEKSEKKTNSEQKQETKKTTEELKQEVEKTFKKLLEAEGDLGKTKNDRGLFRETQAWFGIGKTKEGHINKDFEIKKEIAKKIKEEYRVKYNEFARKLEKEERNKMKKEGKSEATINELIGLWALVDPTISVKEKKVNGTEEEKKVSLFEYMNRNEKKILKKRQEVLSEKEKGLARRLLEKYNNLSKTKKLIYGTVISSVIGATIVLAGGAALSTALGYGAWRGGKTLFRRSTTGALSGVAIKGANAGLTKRVESKKITDFEEAKFDFEKRFKDKKTLSFLKVGLL